jgi:hypothetical protein
MPSTNVKIKIITKRVGRYKERINDIKQNKIKSVYTTFIGNRPLLEES